MQKILRRTATAERQVTRKLKEKAQRIARKERADRLMEYKQSVRSVSVALNEARTARHEDWELGPLAPQRNTPRKNDVESYYGTVDPHRARANYELPKEKIQARVAWAGTIEHLCIKPTDRVVIVEGPYKGIIAAIQDINMDNGTVELDSDALQQNLTVPTVMVNAQKNSAELQLTQKSTIPFPISAIRLVYPLQDEKTGITRDVIIKEIKPRNIFRDRPTKKVTWSRVVPGLNIEIPWPEEKEETFETHPGDTLAVDVEEKTFVPTLLRPPFPEQVIDELRNKYSRFRTRHDADYIAHKEAQEAEKKQRKLMAKTMVTPTEAFNLELQAIKRAKPEPVMTDMMLEKIGELMAKKRDQSKRPAKLDEILSSAPADIQDETAQDETLLALPPPKAMRQGVSRRRRLRSSVLSETAPENPESTMAIPS